MGGRRGLGMRLAGAACLVGAAATHATEVEHKLDHAPYMGGLFALLIAGALGLAVLLLIGALPRLVWSLAGALALSAMCGYVWARTVGMPQLGDHVGHWLDVAGAAALICEAVLVALAAAEVGSRPAVRRLAPLAGVALLVFSAGAAAQEAVEPGAGLASHSHGAGGHDHGANAGHGTHHSEYPNLDAVGDRDIAEARRLLREVRRAAASRFGSYARARAAGFRHFRGRGWARPLVFHARHEGYATDRRVLDPRRPESLVYWWPARGAPQLVAMMFRAPPAQVGRGTPSVLMWHRHRNARTGRLGETAMTHVWLSTDLETAFANCLPVPAVEAANPRFRYAEPRSAQAEESRPCTTRPRG